MKKQLILISILTAFVAIAFTSCGSSNSVYYEEWFYSKGYITNIEDPFEASKIKFEKFVKENNPDSSISRKDYAICYKHAYDRKPRGSIVFKRWNNDTLEYEEMPDRNYQIEITQEADNSTIPGIIFYRDEDDVYIINNLYKFDLTLHTDKYAHADYAFDIKLNGIRNYTFYMDRYTDKSNPFN